MEENWPGHPVLESLHELSSPLVGVFLQVHADCRHAIPDAIAYTRGREHEDGLFEAFIGKLEEVTGRNWAAAIKRATSLAAAVSMNFSAATGPSRALSEFRLSEECLGTGRPP
jgi:hypothetical protein